MTLKLPLKIMTKTISMDQLFETYQKELVQGYCMGCNNYGVNFSCPDSGFDEEPTLRKYQWVTLILTEASTESIKEGWDKLSSKTFKSNVSDDFGETNILASIAMQGFNRTKDRMADLLLAMEEEVETSLSSPPGSCTKCKVCQKKLNQTCIAPLELRYSLEAYGFMVSDIYERFFELKLEWTDGVLPEAYHSCSALFTNEAMDSTEVADALIKQFSEIELSYT